MRQKKPTVKERRQHIKICVRISIREKEYKEAIRITEGNYRNKEEMRWEKKTWNAVNMRHSRFLCQDAAKAESRTLLKALDFRWIFPVDFIKALFSEKAGTGVRFPACI